MTKTPAAFPIALFLMAGCAHPLDRPAKEWTATKLESLDAAVQRGDVRRVRLLLANGKDPNARDPTNGRTALITALIGERTDIIDLLLGAGADPSLPDQMGNTPLHIAAQINDPWLALKILEAGGPPSARNAQGRTFETYLFMTSDALTTARDRAGRQKVLEWIERHCPHCQSIPP